MSEATHGLASTCRVDENSFRENESKEDNAFGEELTNTMHTLASVLDEVADAQSSLCDSLTASLAISLENFAHIEKREADRLQKKSDDDTELFDLTLGRYLHGGRGEKDDGEGLRLKNLQKTLANIDWRPGGGASRTRKKRKLQMSTPPRSAASLRRSGCSNATASSADSSTFGGWSP